MFDKKYIRRLIAVVGRKMGQKISSSYRKLA